MANIYIINFLSPENFDDNYLKNETIHSLNLEVD